MAEDVDVRIGDRSHHALGHLLAAHPQLAVHAGDHDIELREDRVAVVERAVLQDVDLDAGEDAERRQQLVEPGHVGQLLRQTLGTEAVGDGEPRRVIGEHHVLVPQRNRRAGHRLDGGAAVAPPAVHVQIGSQGVAVGGAGRR